MKLSLLVQAWRDEAAAQDKLQTMNFSSERQARIDLLESKADELEAAIDADNQPCDCNPGDPCRLHREAALAQQARCSECGGLQSDGRVHPYCLPLAQQAQPCDHQFVSLQIFGCAKCGVQAQQQQPDDETIIRVARAIAGDHYESWPASFQDDARRAIAAMPKQSQPLTDGPWPLAKEPTHGWTLDFAFLESIQRAASVGEDESSASLEQIEGILLAARDRMARHHALVEVVREGEYATAVLERHAQPVMPTPEQIAEAIWRATAHFSTANWTLAEISATVAWDTFLAQADAVLALFAPKPEASSAFEVATTPCIPACAAAGPATHTNGCHNARKWPMKACP